jgi:hypothetical protein
MAPPRGGARSAAPAGGNESRSPWRSFANHALAVYFGNGQTLKPGLDESPADCEQITGLLSALPKAVVDLEPATGDFGADMSERTITSTAVRRAVTWPAPAAATAGRSAAPRCLRHRAAGPLSTRASASPIKQSRASYSRPRYSAAGGILTARALIPR